MSINETVPWLNFSVHQGLRNNAYKNFREQDAFDRGQRQADAYQRGAEGYGVDQRAYGKNFGVAGKNYGAANVYPYVGAGAGLVAPAYGGAAYGGYPLAKGYGYYH